MGSLFSLSRWLVVLGAATTVWCAPRGALAQLGVLNPNPTMPAERTLGNGAYGGSDDGMGIGRGPIPTGESREKNPAKEMLVSDGRRPLVLLRWRALGAVSSEPAPDLRAALNHLVSCREKEDGLPRPFSYLVTRLNVAFTSRNATAGAFYEP